MAFSRSQLPVRTDRNSHTTHYGTNSRQSTSLFTGNQTHHNIEQPTLPGFSTETGRKANKLHAGSFPDKKTRWVWPTVLLAICYSRSYVEQFLQ